MYEYRATIRSIYDGDTIRADIDLGFGVILHDQQLRLYGINAPEMHGESREAGLLARNALREKISAMTVILRTHRDKKEKFGRWLADIYLGDTHINAWMIDRGFAVKYLM